MVKDVPTRIKGWHLKDSCELYFCYWYTSIQNRSATKMHICPLTLISPSYGISLILARLRLSKYLIGAKTKLFFFSSFIMSCIDPAGCRGMSQLLALLQTISGDTNRLAVQMPLLLSFMYFRLQGTPMKGSGSKRTTVLSAY